MLGRRALIAIANALAMAVNLMASHGDGLREHGLSALMIDIVTIFIVIT